MWRVNGRQNLKKVKDRESGWKRLSARMGLVVLVVLGGFFGARELGWGPRAARVGSFLASHVHFSLREVQVNGARRLAGSEIVAMTGLKPGVGMWELSLGAIEERLRRHPWIKNAVVRREFPDRVVIEVEERVPKAIAALDKFYYVDAEGFVFQVVGKGAEAEEPDLPVITGLAPADWLSRGASFREKIREVLRVSELFGQQSMPLSEIRFSRSGGVVLYPIGFRLAIQMGWGEWPGKIGRLERVLSEWKGNERRLYELDLRFRDQVVARVRQIKG